LIDSSLWITIFQKEIQCAVDSRRRCIAPIVLELVEQIVGLDRFLGRGDEFQDLQADFGQPQAATLARKAENLAHESLRVVRVMMPFSRGGLAGHWLSRASRQVNNTG
jgi:hypothetical protein